MSLIRLCLPFGMLSGYLSGESQFFIILRELLQNEGHEVLVEEQTENSLNTAGDDVDFAIIFKGFSPQDNVFTIRRIGLGPYLTLERAFRRKDMRLSLLDFKPEDWRDFVKSDTFSDMKKIAIGEHTENISIKPDAPVMVPLQGLFLQTRGEDVLSGIEIFAELRKLYPERDIIYRKHPSYKLSIPEQRALKFAARSYNLRISTRMLYQDLPEVGIVVGLNSTVLLRAMAFHHPVLCCANADFDKGGVALRDFENFSEAFKKTETLFQREPWEYDAFLAWYLSHMALFLPEHGPQKLLSIMKELGLH